MNLLLVEPQFPLADKSKNYAHFLPIGLLKIGSWHRQIGDNVKLIRGNKQDIGIIPHRILITSLFTYWSQYVHDTAKFYHGLYPNAEIEIGGIYSSLMPEHCQRTSPFAKTSVGPYQEGIAENVQLDYSLLPEDVDYQIIHASRGCVRSCAFCGTWRIEPKFIAKDTVLPEIKKSKLIFFDNNLLANPNIKNILQELVDFRFSNGKRVTWECQSGLDLRLLNPEIAKLLKDSRMTNPRIAWDGIYATWPLVRRKINVLKKLGYGRKELFVFMIYNHEISYNEMRKKLDACRRWQVRVIDCRYRPLDATEDGYNPRAKTQSKKEYFIHAKWTDKQIRTFRRSVRRQNIAILLDLPNGRYIKGCEEKKV